MQYAQQHRAMLFQCCTQAWQGGTFYATLPRDAQTEASRAAHHCRLQSRHGLASATAQHGRKRLAGVDVI